MQSECSIKELDHMKTFLLFVIIISLYIIALIILIDPFKIIVDRIDGAPFWFHEEFDFVEKENLWYIDVNLQTKLLNKAL